MLLKEFCQSLNLTETQLKDVPQLNIENFPDSFNAFLWAAQNDYANVASCLLEIPIVLAAAIANNNTLLISAAKLGYITLVDCLLKIPRVLAVATEINAALQVAAFKGNLAMVDLLLNIPTVLATAAAGYNAALRMAAQNGHLSIVNRLLKISAVLAEVTAANNAALRWAAANGHLTVVNRLLEIPAIAVAVTACNNGALRWAVENAHITVLNRLLEIDEVRRLCCLYLCSFDEKAKKLICTSLQRALIIELQKAAILPNNPDFKKNVVDHVRDKNFFPGLSENDFNKIINMDQRFQSLRLFYAPLFNGILPLDIIQYLLPFISLPMSLSYLAEEHINLPLDTIKPVIFLFKAQEKPYLKKQFITTSKINQRKFLEEKRMESDECSWCRLN